LNYVIQQRLVKGREGVEGGIEYGWTKGNASHSLVLAVKKRLAKADIYAKVDHTGEVSFAQTAVSEYFFLPSTQKLKLTGNDASRR